MGNNMLSTLFILLLMFLFTPLSLARDIDCSSCHRAGGVAADFSRFYSKELNHHPFDSVYPGTQTEDFIRPTAMGDVAFFDSNGNAQPDASEIQLFGAGTPAMTCSTCHDDHGVDPNLFSGINTIISTVTGQKNMHLRSNGDLCAVCHQK